MNNHIHPNQEIDSELLSAYLDDELTANERLVVEQALENSPSLRESLEELKVLSNEIQQLAVEFHPNEQQMIDTVINNIRDRNLSVHGQAPYSNVKIPVLTKGWKQRLQIPALLTLTAGVLAILTLRFMPNEQSMTLVQTDTIAEIQNPEILPQAEDNDREFKPNTGNSPLRAGKVDAPMGDMGGGLGAFAGEQALQKNQDYRDNASSRVVGLSGAADGPTAPAPHSRASALPIASAVADSEDEQRRDRQTTNKSVVADVTYHIQVKQKDLSALLALLTTQQHLAQNMLPEKKVVGLAEGQENIAAKPQRRVLSNEPLKSSVRKSTANQIVLFRSNVSQLEVLVGLLQKNSAFVLSMNHLQHGAQAKRSADKEKNSPNANSKDQNAIMALSDTIFSIQVIATP